MEAPKFNCNACGACCLNAGERVKDARAKMGTQYENRVVRELANFPYGFDETGRCEKLGTDNKCTIYDSRPLICSVDRVYEKFVNKSMELQEYYDFQNRACRVLQKRFGLPVME